MRIMRRTHLVLYLIPTMLHAVSTCHFTTIRHIRYLLIYSGPFLPQSTRHTWNWKECPRSCRFLWNCRWHDIYREWYSRREPLHTIIFEVTSQHHQDVATALNSRFGDQAWNITSDENTANGFDMVRHHHALPRGQY